MPLIGFDCKSKGKTFTIPECLACARDHQQTCHFDYPILSGMVRLENGAKGQAYRVTELLTCLRKAFFERTRDYTVTPESRYWAFRGQLTHVLIEFADTEGAIKETRFYKKLDTVNGGEPNFVTITGQPDIVYPNLQLIRDYKTAVMVPKDGQARQHHIWQVNIYHWLLQGGYQIDDNGDFAQEVNIPIEQAEIIYMDMSKVVRAPMPIWDLDEVENYILGRVLQLEAAKKGQLPPVPDTHGQWQCNPQYCSFTKLCLGHGIENLEVKRPTRARR